MEFETIIYEKDGSTGIITLKRPKSMNAISERLVKELNMVIDEIERDEEVMSVIFSGGKKIFAAGADIKEISGIGTSIEAHRFVSSVQSLFNRIESLEKPVIAAVSGLALGGGCELALTCDLRIATENASFGLPEIKIGVIPGGGGTQRLPRLIGAGRAKELLYTGDPVGADEAFRIGLVNKVVPLDSLMDEAKKMATKLAKQPSIALKMIKASVNKGLSMDLQSGLAYEACCFEILFSTEDQKEGMKAFVEKRLPLFKGK